MPNKYNPKDLSSKADLAPPPPTNIEKWGPRVLVGMTIAGLAAGGLAVRGVVKKLDELQPHPGVKMPEIQRRVDEGERLESGKNYKVKEVINPTFRQR